MHPTPFGEKFLAPGEGLGEDRFIKLPNLYDSKHLEGDKIMAAT